jgi:hypothetical protein
MSALGPLLSAYCAGVRSRAPSGVVETGLPGVSFFWIDHPTNRSPLRCDPGEGWSWDRGTRWGTSVDESCAMMRRRAL